MQPLNRADPITAEALERIGFECRFTVGYQSPWGLYQALWLDDTACDGEWLVSTFDERIELSILSTLGELADLCRCLKIDLLEVPE